MVTGSSSRIKKVEHGVYHPPSFSAEVKEKVELQVCFPFMVSHRVSFPVTAGL
jgi:hypothetical protein